MRLAGYNKRKACMLQQKQASKMATSVLVDRNVQEENRAVELFRAKEEEIEKKKMQVREKLKFQLDRAEEKTRRLSQVWEEVEVFKDPMRKELAIVRKKVDKANHELKSLRKSCLKKEKEYREAMEVLQNKNKEKKELTITLVELVKKSEEARLKKLDDLSKIIDPSG
ncbi:hypothetical protein QVD17_32372 [Tagetes erecta]|uniref:RAB6-interacting golgin n=1 Tax=Tagetes erecta TaxID=13708 RepID=A0AAD8NQ30_TARER|nr:hypothetical protein QVD17_32372 [Tagetes erecta]